MALQSCRLPRVSPGTPPAVGRCNSGLLGAILLEPRPLAILWPEKSHFKGVADSVRNNIIPNSLWQNRMAIVRHRNKRQRKNNGGRLGRATRAMEPPTVSRFSEEIIEN